MKKALLLMAILPLALGGCVVGDGDPDVTVAPRPVTVDTTPDRPDVNVQVETPDIEIKQDPPYRSTTGF